MALPSENITMTMVRNEIGESTNKLTVLRTSSLNNWWGFKHGIWGERPLAEDPKRLGDYRGYVHDWRAYSLSSIGATQGPIEDPNDPGTNILPELTTDLGWHDGIKYVVMQNRWPSDLSRSIERSYPSYRVEFKRTSDFHVGGFAEVETSVAGYSSEYGDKFTSVLTIPCDFPPDDTSTELTPGNTVYVRVKPLDGPFLYDAKQHAVDLGDPLLEGNNDEDGYIFELTVPDKPIISYEIDIEDVLLTATDSSGNVSYEANFTLKQYIDGVEQTDATEEAVITMEVTPEDSMGNLGATDSQQFTIYTDQTVSKAFLVSYPKNQYTEPGDTLTVNIESTYFNVQTSYEHETTPVDTTRTVTIV